MLTKGVGLLQTEACKAGINLERRMGQWWFRYDKRRGCVASRYPVFSAHQDGTYCIARFGRGYWPKLSCGDLERTFVDCGQERSRNNELGVDLRSLDQALIWDSLDAWRMTRLGGIMSNYSHVSTPLRVKNLRIRYEARPDHFGRLLYAFGEVGLPNGRSLAAHA
jgi:hypothetical protein